MQGIVDNLTLPKHFIHHHKSLSTRSLSLSLPPSLSFLPLSDVFRYPTNFADLDHTRYVLTWQRNLYNVRHNDFRFDYFHRRLLAPGNSDWHLNSCL